MPRAAQVTSVRWRSVSILFDNGLYSVIAGEYRNDNEVWEEVFGERWNGEGQKPGFPQIRGAAVWHVVPGFLQKAVLRACLDELEKNPRDQVQELNIPAGEKAAKTRTKRITVWLEE